MTTPLRLVMGLVLAGALPGAALAQGAVIRLEAKRDPQAAAQAAQGWADRFDGVVTLALPGGWTGIAIGPLPEDRAGPLLERLKQAGKVQVEVFGLDHDRDHLISAGGAAGTGTPVHR